MADPYCRGCAQASGGCWRHNGTGIYQTSERGELVQTHAPARFVTPSGWIETLVPLVPLVTLPVDQFIWTGREKQST